MPDPVGTLGPAHYLQGAPQLDEALANLAKHALQGLPIGAQEMVRRSFGGGGGTGVVWNSVSKTGADFRAT